MSFLIATMFALAASSDGPTVNMRGIGNMSCTTAFLPINRMQTESWIAGFWAAWDMSQIAKSKPLAANSDLNGIVAEVEKACREKPSNPLVFATLDARAAVKARNGDQPVSNR